MSFCLHTKDFYNPVAFIKTKIALSRREQPVSVWMFPILTPYKDKGSILSGMSCFLPKKLVKLNYGGDSTLKHSC